MIDANLINLKCQTIKLKFYYETKYDFASI